MPIRNFYNVNILWRNERGNLEQSKKQFESFSGAMTFIGEFYAAASDPKEITIEFSKMNVPKDEVVNE